MIIEMLSFAEFEYFQQILLQRPFHKNEYFHLINIKAVVALWHQHWRVRLLCGNCNHSVSIWGIHSEATKPRKQMRVKQRYNLTVTRVLLVTLECLIENYQKKKKKNK